MSENNYGAFMMKSAVAVSDDINAITQPGIYFIPPANSSSPDNQGGVLTLHSGNPIRRTFTSDSVIALVSTRNGNTWSAWSGPLSRTNPFGDIKTDGAAAIATALSNLGLDTAGKRNGITAVSSATGKIIFPALQGATPLNVIIQWGIASGRSIYNLTFPQSHNVATLTVVATGDGIGASPTESAFIEVGNMTLEGFTASCIKAGSSGQQLTPRSIHWISIGI